MFIHRSRKFEEGRTSYQYAQKSKGFGAERKAQKALNAAEYHELYRNEITLFESAEKYLRDVLQYRFDPKKLPPISRWQNELSGKTAEKDSLYRDYHVLKDETYKVEKIQWSVNEILHNDSPKQAQQKSWDVEL